MLLLLDISRTIAAKILSAFDLLKCMRKADFDVPSATCAMVPDSSTH